MPHRRYRPTLDARLVVTFLCPLSRSRPSIPIEPVIDSSRYFVLRVEDEATRRHAFLGLGFRERDSASDFKLAVQEHQNQINRDKEAARSREAYERQMAEKAAAGVPTKLHDFSLKGTVHISVPKKFGAGGNAGAVSREGVAGEDRGGGAAGFGMDLAPPPAAPHGMAVGLSQPPGAGMGMGVGAGVGSLLAPPPAAGMVAPFVTSSHTPAAHPAAPQEVPVEEGWASFDTPATGDDDWADFQS